MSYYYVATPYRAYPDGLERAHQAACRFAAELLDLGIEIYAPIAHTHHIAKFVTVADPHGDYWVERQRPFVLGSCGVIVATHMPGWDKSSGIRWEVALAAEHGLPILDRELEALTMPPTER